MELLFIILALLSQLALLAFSIHFYMKSKSVSYQLNSKIK